MSVKNRTAKQRSFRKTEKGEKGIQREMGKENPYQASCRRRDKAEMGKRKKE